MVKLRFRIRYLLNSIHLYKGRNVWIKDCIMNREAQCAFHRFMRGISSTDKSKYYTDLSEIQVCCLSSDKFSASFFILLKQNTILLIIVSTL